MATKIIIKNVNPGWWLDKDNKKNLTPLENTPTFKNVDLFKEYLKRDMDDIMSYDEYKEIRKRVINILEDE